MRGDCARAVGLYETAGKSRLSAFAALASDLEIPVRHEHAIEMFDAPLPSVRRLGGTDDERHVPGERDVDLLCLIRNGETLFATQFPIDLDEVNARCLHPVDKIPCFLWRFHDIRIRPLRLRAIHEPSDGTEPWPEKAAVR